MSIFRDIESGGYPMALCGPSGKEQQSNAFQDLLHPEPQTPPLVAQPVAAPQPVSQANSPTISKISKGYDASKAFGSVPGQGTSGQGAPGDNQAKAKILSSLFHQ